MVLAIKCRFITVPATKFTTVQYVFGTTRWRISSTRFLENKNTQAFSLHRLTEVWALGHQHAESKI
jgi:hypothetical protein